MPTRVCSAHGTNVALPIFRGPFEQQCAMLICGPVFCFTYVETSLACHLESQQVHPSCVGMPGLLQRALRSTA